MPVCGYHRRVGATNTRTSCHRGATTTYASWSLLQKKIVTPQGLYDSIWFLRGVKDCDHGIALIPLHRQCQQGLSILLVDVDVFHVAPLSASVIAVAPTIDTILSCETKKRTHRHRCAETTYAWRCPAQEKVPHRANVPKGAKSSGGHPNTVQEQNVDAPVECRRRSFLWLHRARGDPDCLVSRL